MVPSSGYTGPVKTNKDPTDRHHLIVGTVYTSHPSKAHVDNVLSGSQAYSTPHMRSNPSYPQNDPLLCTLGGKEASQ